LGGGRTPGPIGVPDKPTYEPEKKDQLRGDGQAPGALKEGNAQSQGPRLRGWPRSISWDEFHEVSHRPSGQEEDAQIETTLEQPSRVRIVREGGQLRLGDYVGTLRVVGRNSWIVSSKKTDALLRHEQGHFDISGLVGRDLMTALGNLRAQNAQELQREVTRLYEAYDAWGDQLSEEYDDQTNHGRNADAQQDWETRIAECIQQGTSLGTPPS